jgi:hypothetical protein
MRLIRLLSFVVVSLLAGQASAAPYLPKSDSQVLERLPFKPNDPVARDMAQMRAELQRDPKNVEVAVRLARSYYELVGAEGDPRYLGYAQAVLAPWWDMPAPPTEVQVLRAGLAQFRHDFEGALADLTKVLEREPRHTRARALRATIHIVQARYQQGRSDCQALKDLTSDLITAACIAMVDGLTGHAGPAYETLLKAFKAEPQASADEKLWALLRLAELAQRLDRTEAIDAHFRQAMALGITETFLYAAYADFLLDQKRAAEVVKMLKDKTPSDGLLLRLVFAERTLQLPTAKQREATLAARYAAAQIRGDTVHQQEEARFVLHVYGDTAKAVFLASENWKVQREPRDARILLEAALAARNPGAAQPVLQWLDENHVEDRYMNGLAQQIKALKGQKP